MIRVIYRWHVVADRAAAFEEWWHRGTLDIRTGRPGALGSLLLRSRADPEQFVAVARWETEEHVAAFWRQADAEPFDGAVLQTLEVLDELDELTIM